MGNCGAVATDVHCTNAKRSAYSISEVFPFAEENFTAYKNIAHAEGHGSRRLDVKAGFIPGQRYTGNRCRARTSTLSFPFTLFPPPHDQPPIKFGLPLLQRPISVAVSYGRGDAARSRMKGEGGRGARRCGRSTYI